MVVNSSEWTLSQLKNPKFQPAFGKIRYSHSKIEINCQPPTTLFYDTILTNFSTSSHIHQRKSIDCFNQKAIKCKTRLYAQNIYYRMYRTPHKNSHPQFMKFLMILQNIKIPPKQLGELRSTIDLISFIRIKKVCCMCPC